MIVMMGMCFGRGGVGFALGRIKRIRGIGIGIGQSIGEIGLIGKVMLICDVEGMGFGEGGISRSLANKGFELEAGETFALLLR